MTFMIFTVCMVSFSAEARVITESVGELKDTLNGSRGHNFSMNVVIQENDFNDYVLSFSRNSAVDSEEE